MQFFFEACDEFVFMKKMRYARNFLLFKNVFNIDQFVFGLVRGSAKVLDNLV